MIEETGMSILERYRAYADAFVESYEDAVYDHRSPEDANGRDAVIARCIAKLKGGMDGFDRALTLKRRAPDFETPTVDVDMLTMRWAVTDTKAGAPAPIISGVDAAVFESDQVARLRDGFDTTAEKTMALFMPAHGGS
jgi:hypothetical protein